MPKHRGQSRSRTPHQNPSPRRATTDCAKRRESASAAGSGGAQRRSDAMNGSGQRAPADGDWRPDPTGRYKLRWQLRTGEWTQWASTADGKRMSDPVVLPETASASGASASAGWRSPADQRHEQQVSSQVREPRLPKFLTTAPTGCVSTPSRGAHSIISRPWRAEDVRLCSLSRLSDQTHDREIIERAGLSRVAAPGL